MFVLLLVCLFCCRHLVRWRDFVSDAEFARGRSFRSCGDRGEPQCGPSAVSAHSNAAEPGVPRRGHEGAGGGAREAMADRGRIRRRATSGGQQNQTAEPSHCTALLQTQRTGRTSHSTHDGRRIYSFSAHCARRLFALRLRLRLPHCTCPSPFWIRTNAAQQAVASERASERRATRTTPTHDALRWTHSSAAQGRDGRSVLRRD